VNWLYVGFVVAAATIALGFIAWSVTSPVVQAAAANEPLPGGWSWVSVLVLDGCAMALLGGLLWRVYKDAHTEIDTMGVSQPSLHGRRSLSWQDVRRVSRYAGVGWHLHGDRFRIIVAPYAYRDPQSVIAEIEARAGVGRPTRRCS
jgi:hypothetical protein